MKVSNQMTNVLANSALNNIIPEKVDADIIIEHAHWIEESGHLDIVWFYDGATYSDSLTIDWDQTSRIVKAYDKKSWNYYQLDGEFNHEEYFTWVKDSEKDEVAVECILHRQFTNTVKSR